MVHGAGWFWSWWHNMISMMIATIMVFDGWQARHPLVRYYGPTCLLADQRLLLSYHCDTDNGDGGGDDVDGDHHHHPIHPIGFHWWELSWENYLSVWLKLLRGDWSSSTHRKNYVAILSLIFIYHREYVHSVLIYYMSSDHCNADWSLFVSAKNAFDWGLQVVNLGCFAIGDHFCLVLLEDVGQEKVALVQTMRQWDWYIKMSMWCIGKKMWLVKVHLCHGTFDFFVEDFFAEQLLTRSKNQYVT